jgi:hypothetical protein
VCIGEIIPLQWFSKELKMTYRRTTGFVASSLYFSFTNQYSLRDHEIRIRTNPRDAQLLLLSPYTCGAPYHRRKKQIRAREGLSLLSFSTGISTMGGRGGPRLKENEIDQPELQRWRVNGGLICRCWFEKISETSHVSVLVMICWVCCLWKGDVRAIVVTGWVVVVGWWRR